MSSVKKWKNACPLSRRITPMSSVKKMEQEKEGTCALWLFVSPKSSVPGIFPIAKISEPPKSRTCPSHLPFCQKGIFESYVMCLVSGRFCTYPTLCNLPLVYIYMCKCIHIYVSYYSIQNMMGYCCLAGVPAFWRKYRLWISSDDFANSSCVV